jgi:endonuclease/exonuclease/phosphatase family metal-dependent hydrolase
MMDPQIPMKRLALLCLFLSSLLAGAAEPLRFVAWNIEWFPGHRPTASEDEADKQMKGCQEALKKMNPDIFVAEEIRDWAAFHELVSAVPGLTVHVVSSFKDVETGRIRNQQIGIASKLKCRGAWWETWAANYPGISRGFSFAALEHPAGGLLMVYGNHLKSNSGGNNDEGARNNAAMRDEQVKQLLMHKQGVETAFSDQPIAGWIAAGDFNTNHDGQFPQDSVIKSMTLGGYHNTWANVPKEKRLTWRSQPESKFEPTTFDYIFTQGIKPTDAFILEVPRELSDHYPVGIRVMK